MGEIAPVLSPLLRHRASSLWVEQSVHEAPAKANKSAHHPLVWREKQVKSATINRWLSKCACGVSRASECRKPVGVMLAGGTGDEKTMFIRDHKRLQAVTTGDRIQIELSRILGNMATLVSVLFPHCVLS
jgi:hypothetical protein